MHLENLHVGDSILITGPTAGNEDENDSPKKWMQARRSHFIAGNFHGHPLFVQAIQPPFIRVVTPDGSLLFLDSRDIQFIKADAAYAERGLAFGAGDAIGYHLPNKLACLLSDVGIDQIADLANWDRTDLAQVDGIGPETVKKLEMLACAAGLFIQG